MRKKSSKALNFCLILRKEKEPKSIYSSAVMDALY